MEKIFGDVRRWTNKPEIFNVVARIATVVARIATVVTRIATVVARIDNVVTHTDNVVTRIATVVTHIATVVTRIDVVVTHHVSRLIIIMIIIMVSSGLHLTLLVFGFYSHVAVVTVAKIVGILLYNLRCVIIVNYFLIFDIIVM